MSLSKDEAKGSLLVRQAAEVPAVSSPQAARNKGQEGRIVYWIYDYPVWSVWLLFCSVFVAFTWIGTLGMRRTIHSWIHGDARTNEMVGIALSSFFVLFGLLLGLLAVATYQNYANIGDIVDKEASSLSALYRDVGGYPQPIRGQLQERLREYTRYTIEEGWEQQRRGIAPKGESVRSGLIVRTMLSFEPSKKSEEIIHAEALRQGNQRIQLSRARMSNITTGLPAVLWWVVAFGAVLNLVLIWMQDMEIHVHLILGAILASILATVIFLIAELDNPFRGEVAIGPDSLAGVYNGIMKAEPTGTAADAKDMLAKAVAAVEADKVKALETFNKGQDGFLEGDLYPFCFNLSDGIEVANVNQPQKIGRSVKDSKDVTGKAYGLELYAAAQKPAGDITEVSYMFLRPGANQEPSPKVAFVTRAGDLGCAVGYYQ